MTIRFHFLGILIMIQYGTLMF